MTLQIDKIAASQSQSIEKSSTLIYQQEQAAAFGDFRKRLHRTPEGAQWWGNFWTDATGEYYTDKATGKLVEAKRTLWHPADVSIPVNPNNTQHKYFGVHPSLHCRTQLQRSIKGEIAGLNCLFTEVDGKDMVQPTEADIGQESSRITEDSKRRLALGELSVMTPESVIKKMALAAAKVRIFNENRDHYNKLAHDHVMSMNPRPSAIIHSGGGYHLYWFLTDTFVLVTAEDRRRAEYLQGAWVVYVGGDEGAKDLPHVLRPTGTYNQKPRYGPDFPLVHFIHLDYSIEYSLADLEKLLPPQPLPKQKQERAQRGDGQSATPLDPATPANKGSSIPAIFNASYSLPDMLSKYGYTQQGTRWTRPGGDNPGVEIKEDGRALIWSSNDPLFNEGYHTVSAFDAYMIWEHDKDFQAALVGAAVLLGMELTIAHIARPVVEKAEDFFTHATLSKYVADSHKAQLQQPDGTSKTTYRTAHPDKLTAGRVLEVMRKAGRAQGLRTTYRQLAKAHSSTGIPVAPLDHKTIKAALGRLDFAFDVEQTERYITITLKRDFITSVLEVDCTNFPTKSLTTSRYLVGNFTQSTLDRRKYQNDDAFLVGVSPKVREDAKETEREFEQEGVTYPAVMKAIPPGLSTYGIAIMRCLIDAGGSGATVAEMQEESGASLSTVRKVLRGLRPLGLESQRQYKLPSLYFLPADAFDQIGTCLAPSLKTYGAGVHRLDKMLKHRQEWAAREAAEAATPYQKQRAQEREANAEKQRLELRPHLHPESTPAQHREAVRVDVAGHRGIMPSEFAEARISRQAAGERTQEREAKQQLIKVLKAQGRTWQEAKRDALYAEFSEADADDIAHQVARARGWRVAA